MDIQDESLGWIDQMDELHAHIQANPEAKRAELKTLHDHGDSQITTLKNLKICLDSAAIEKIRLAEKANPSYILSLNAAKALTGLKGKVAEGSPTGGLHGTVHAALDQVLTRRLAPKKIKALVQWIIAGHPADTFMVSAQPKRSPRLEASAKVPSEFDPPRKRSKRSTASQPQPAPQPPTEVDETFAQLVKQFEEASGEEKVAAQKRLTAYAANLAPAAAPLAESRPSQKSKKDKSSPSLLLESLAGINIFSKLKSKIKKKEDLTPGDYGLLFLEDIGKLLHWLVKHPLKWFGKTIHFVWKIVIDSLKVIGIYKFVRAVVVLGLAALLLWAAWDIHQHGLSHPFRVISSFFPSHKEASDASGNNNESSPGARPADSPMESAQPNHAARHNASQQVKTSPAKISSTSVIAAADNSAAQEIAAIPPNSLIKPIALQPSDMGGAMAGRRLQDLMEPEKFKLMIGHDAQKVVNVTATSTNLTLTFQDGIGGLLGGASKLDFYWEDVKTIHVSEIVTGLEKTHTLYQCVVAAADAKTPFVAQCSTPENLNHLVSALEFWIRAARAGQGAPIASLPYLHQGLCLTNDDKVSLLWAESPADKAGVKLGTRAWSAGKNAPQQQSKTEMETALQNWASGSYDFYFVTPAEWANAQDHRDYKHDYGYKPARQKVSLKVP